jgi:hypothetical protein
VAQAYRSVLPNDGWLVSEEEDRITMGAWNPSGWTWMQTVRASVAQPQDLVDLIYQEMQLASVALSKTQVLPVLIHSPTLAQRQLPATDGVRLTMVRPALPAEGQPGSADVVGYAYAMLGRTA